MMNHFTHSTYTGLLPMGLVVLVVTVGLWPQLSYPESTRLPISSGGLPAAPSFESIPPPPEWDEIRLGYHLIVNTQKYAKSFVGNGLSCSNCHLDGGRKVGAGTYVGFSMPTLAIVNVRADGFPLRSGSMSALNEA